MRLDVGRRERVASGAAQEGLARQLPNLYLVVQAKQSRLPEVRGGVRADGREHAPLRDVLAAARAAAETGYRGRADRRGLTRQKQLPRTPGRTPEPKTQGYVSEKERGPK